MSNYAEKLQSDGRYNRVKNVFMQILYYRKKVFIEKLDNETFPKKSSS